MLLLWMTGVAVVTHLECRAGWLLVEVRHRDVPHNYSNPLTSTGLNFSESPNLANRGWQHRRPVEKWEVTGKAVVFSTHKNGQTCLLLKENNMSNNTRIAKQKKPRHSK